jgi:hypothetical protein
LNSQNNPTLFHGIGSVICQFKPDAANQCNLVSIASPINKIINSIGITFASQLPVVFLPAQVNETTY